MTGRGLSKFTLFTPVVGRGRSLIGTNGVFQSETVDFADEESLGIDSIPCLEPQFSTPVVSGENTTQQLRDFIGELGMQIGESIASRLLTNQQQATPKQPSCDAANITTMSDQAIDLSKVSLIVRSDIREPPMFRGEGDDKYSIHEWIDVMEVYLQKRSLSLTEQRCEILNHLLGKAKNIVKVGLKSSETANPETIYSILRRYFSETPRSCLPLADFYATQPRSKETPVDYWVRLNTAAETADRCLRQQGGRIDNMDAEIAVMFIKNCPDPSLACVFKCKPIAKWSLTEVQEVIDEHQREQQMKKTSTARVNVLQVATAVTSVHPHEPETDHAHVNAAKLTVTNSPKLSAEAPSDPSALEHVLNMLERVLEQNNRSTYTARSHPSPPVRFGPCQICGSETHSTRAHCMRERRCFGCFKAGHQRRNCTAVFQQGSRPPVQGNQATHTREGTV
ncbi:uncharacterized protein LOC129190385 [Dunckerocampus dactyliophorus]|uniref:uncharacterized protein LOC129190385 n=1 Tax=Dunckerocampus dactyliophorus TaxID=161453 RepID=UPI00240654E9|nr:uncharacterized protein LOC129190385 [Dunckerocampus dactyliophorus]